MNANGTVLSCTIHDPMALSNSAIVVIVLVCCLASVALGAAILRPWTPQPADCQRLNIPHEQAAYMRSVRETNLRRIYLAFNGGRPQRQDTDVFDTLWQLYWGGSDVTDNILF
jgi:hypothetical protein